LEKYLEKGSAPSRANAQVLRAVATWAPIEQGSDAIKMMTPHTTAAVVFGKTAAKILATGKLGFNAKMVSIDPAA
jgi:hypothetical protein